MPEKLNAWKEKLRSKLGSQQGVDIKITTGVLSQPATVASLPLISG